MIKILPLFIFICLSFQLTGCAQNSGQAQTNQPKTTQTPESQLKTVNVPSGVKTGSKLPPYLVENAKSFYIKADADLPFSQILKVVKAVQESSPTSYRAKFIIQPAEETGKFEKTANGRYVVNFDLGIPEKPNAIPRPNPLFLAMKLDAAGKITLNTNPVERSRLKDTLLKIFNEREQNGVFEEGANEVYRRLTLYPAPDVKYGDVIKFVDELNETNAKVEFGDLGNFMTDPLEVPQLMTPPKPKKMRNNVSGPLEVKPD